MKQLEVAIRSIKTELESVKSILLEEASSSFDGLGAIAQEFLGSYGKMLRPILVLLSAHAASGAVNKKTLHCAATIEMVHSATLIHDDVIDRADSRHGKRSLFSAIGGHKAVLVGDFLFSKALKVSSDVGAYVEIDRVIRAIEELVEGELMQGMLVESEEVDMDKYFRVIGLKTASLIEAAASIGASSVGANEQQKIALEKYAHTLGVIFQIQDDILDYMPLEVTGKSAFNDILEGKITLPLLLAMQCGGDGILDDFKNKKTQKVIQFVEKHKGVEQSIEYMCALGVEAIEYLAPIAQSTTKDALVSLVEFAQKRKK